MDVLTVAAVLTLLSVSAAKPLQNCEDLIQPAALDKTQISGKWIVIEGTADHPKHTEILKIVNSSMMDVVLSSDRDTAVMKVRDMLNGKCLYYLGNVTFSSNTFVVIHENGTSTCSVLPTSPDCLVLSFTTVDGPDIIKSLYIFGRTKKINQSDLEMYREQVKCLGLPQPSFTYDGTQDMCPEKPEEEVKDAHKH